MPVCADNQANLLPLLRLSDKYEIEKLKIDIDVLLLHMRLIKNALALNLATFPASTYPYLIATIYGLDKTEARSRQDVVSNLHHYLTIAQFEEMFIQLMALYPRKGSALVLDALAYKESASKAGRLESKGIRDKERTRMVEQQRKLDDIIDYCQTV